MARKEFGVNQFCMFKKLLNIFFPGQSSTTSSTQTILQPQADEFSIAGLRDDFEKRTWNYDRLKSTLDQDDPRLLNWIGSVDRSGYIREKSLRYLISNYIPGDENRILLRLEDWVPQVQKLAREWVLKSFESLPWQSILENDCLILFLSRREKLAGDPAMQEINRVLLAKFASIDRESFFALKTGFRRYMYLLSLRNDQHLRKWLLEDPEPSNRLLIFWNSGPGQITDNERARIIKDKAIAVRRRYISLQIRDNSTPSQLDLKIFAFDPNRGLRELAGFYLKKYYGINVYDLYHAKEGEEFYYIADFARKEDIDYYLQGLKSSCRRTRLICLQALSIADYHELAKLNIPVLLSENRKTRAILCQFIPRLLTLEELEKLRDVFRKTSPNGLITYLRLIHQKSHWAFVESAVTEMKSDFSESLFLFVDSIIRTRVAVYEKLPVELRASIIRNAALLMECRNPRISELLSRIEFSMKNA
ncbi:MAG: hypothetical protein HQM09_14145 [Candidatus Riflebacteria bacterium]|nr:hypothetical protein [Candidatus Riflebacteria bacterium]